MTTYQAYVCINNYLLVAAFDRSEDHIKCIGWTADNFPTPESFEEVEELLATQGYTRTGEWREGARGEFSAPVSRD